MTAAMAFLLAVCALPGAREDTLEWEPGLRRGAPALDEMDRKVLALLLWSRRLASGPAERRYGPKDPRWVEVIESVLAEKKIAVVHGTNGSTVIPLATPLRRPIYPSEHSVALEEAQARLVDMVDCRRAATAERRAVRTGVDLQMTVAPDGTVKEAFFIRFEPRDATVERCMIEVAKGWTFRKSFRQHRMRARLAFGPTRGP